MVFTIECLPFSCGFVEQGSAPVFVVAAELILSRPSTVIQRTNDKQLQSKVATALIAQPLCCIFRRFLVICTRCFSGEEVCGIESRLCEETRGIRKAQ